MSAIARQTFQKIFAADRTPAAPACGLREWLVQQPTAGSDI
jgi:hypothetical protein